MAVMVELPVVAVMVGALPVLQELPGIRGGLGVVQHILSVLLLGLKEAVARAQQVMQELVVEVVTLALPGLMAQPVVAVVVVVVVQLFLTNVAVAVAAQGFLDLVLQGRAVQ